jgi:flagellar basal body-associated protein FliL
MPEDLEPDEIMEEDSPRPAPKKGKSKLLIFGVPIVLIQIVAAYFIVVKFFLPSYPEGEEAEEQQAEEQQIPPDQFGFTWGYNDQTITLWDGKRNRYIVVGLTFETEKEPVATELLPSREPQILDIVRATISSKSMDQLTNPRFQEDTLKAEILAKVNYILPEESTVYRIFMDQFVLQ